MSVLTRRRAERFAALVDAAHPEDAGRPGSADAPLLAVVGALRMESRTPPEARPAFVADLRSRLMAEADTAMVPVEQRLELPNLGRAGHHPSVRRPVRATAAAAVLTIVAGTTGAAVAAEHSLPGQPLYLLKRGIEQTTSALSLSDAARGRADLAQARTRLDEVSSLLDKGRADQAGSTLGSFVSSAESGSDQLFTAYQADADPGDIGTVRSFAATSMQRLADQRQGAPGSTDAAFVRAAEVLTALDTEARLLCPACGSRSPLTSPTSWAVAAPAIHSGAPGAGTSDVQPGSTALQQQALAAGSVLSQPAPATAGGGTGASGTGTTTGTPDPAAATSSAAGGVKGTVKGTVKNPVQQLTGTASTTVQGLGNGLGNGLGSGVDATVPNLGGAASGAVTGLTTGVAGAVDGVGDAVGGSLTGGH